MSNYIHKIVEQELRKFADEIIAGYGTAEGGVMLDHIHKLLKERGIE